MEGDQVQVIDVLLLLNQVKKMLSCSAKDVGSGQFTPAEIQDVSKLKSSKNRSSLSAPNSFKCFCCLIIPDTDFFMGSPVFRCDLYFGSSRITLW